MILLLMKWWFRRDKNVKKNILLPGANIDSMVLYGLK